LNCISQSEREEFENEFKQQYEREKVLLTEENKKLTSELDKVSDSVSFMFIFFLCLLTHARLFSTAIVVVDIILYLMYIFNLIFLLISKIASVYSQCFILPIFTRVFWRKDLAHLVLFFVAVFFEPLFFISLSIPFYSFFQTHHL
jgi:hypothetical protein